MKKVLQILLIILIPEIIIFTIIAMWNPDNLRHPFDNGTIELAQTDHIPVSHASYPELQQDFDSIQDVTKACLQCHNNVDDAFMKTGHWTWKSTDSIPGKGNVEMGKENIINNFCIGVATNEQLCAKYGLYYLPR